ncbi:MAG: coproporphyrinogen dehydrogenase HemZ [Oscillospiraceae bacterium]|nr:coproporphyrinogen dehydrogenase HemZ [Oscillospiraceae bacterium]
MKIYLFGHDYKYAVEQMLLTVFPEERPEYPGGDPEGDRMEVSLRRNGSITEAACLLINGEDCREGRDSAFVDENAGVLLSNRTEQRLLKNAIYRAALRLGVPRPVWGALTGVRPGKVLSRILDEEQNSRDALERFEKEYDVSPERAALCMDTAAYTMRTRAGLKEKDVCLYVGIPFCPTRCSYCSFVSQSVEKSRDLIAPFTEALKKEIRATAKAAASAGLRPVSVYFGGGTPTTLAPEQLYGLFSEIEQRFDLSSVREFTVEAGRPETINPEKLAVMREHGVTRISVNPQTMSDSVLNVIGRKHTAGDILSAVDMVRAAGAFQINMDLIAGLPSDTPENFERSLRTVSGLEPENITVHTLSLKKGSRITLEETEIPSGEEVGRMLNFSSKLLREKGYEPYYLYRQKFMSGGFENTGWTKKGFANLYNICIMEELCSIIAMGGGGSTKLIRPGDGRNIRVMNPKYPKEYIETIGKICADRKKITGFFSKENEHGISAEGTEL